MMTHSEDSSHSISFVAIAPNPLERSDPKSNPMGKQTFIVEHWYGAPTYLDASRLSNGETVDHDFNRVACKRASTALKYLAGWRKQAIEKNLQWLFRTLTRDDAHYAIIATPDGSTPTEVVAEGMMKDLDTKVA